MIAHWLVLTESNLVNAGTIPTQRTQTQGAAYHTNAVNAGRSTEGQQCAIPRTLVDLCIPYSMLGDFGGLS
jgi:hypothetical protein